MKRAVICEGKTDAILVGYFLIKVYGWSYSKHSFLQLPYDKQNEVLSWFTRPDKAGSELVVWGAGGITRVSEKVTAIAERTRDEHLRDDRFDRLVVLVDRDDRTADQCLDLIAGWLRAAGLVFTGPVALGQWKGTTTQLRKSPPETHAVDVLSIVLPPTREGCLEIFLADALRSTGDPDKAIVDGCEKLVEATPAEPYLREPRFRPKATVGAALSIMSPDWVFGDLDEKLKAVAWEEIEVAHNAYSLLADL
jgi:hypothetical protein